MPRGGTDDAELEAPFRDELDDHARVVHLERDPHRGVRALELAEELRHDDGGRAGRGADGQQSGKVAVTLRGDLVEHLLLEREQPLRAAEQARARFGRLDAATGAIEELGAEALLERPHLERDGRLGDAELLGGLRERAPFDHGAERSQLARIHKRML